MFILMGKETNPNFHHLNYVFWVAPFISMSLLWLMSMVDLAPNVKSQSEHSKAHTIHYYISNEKHHRASFKREKEFAHFGNSVLEL